MKKSLKMPSKALSLVVVVVVLMTSANASCALSMREPWRITAYCACRKCCGKWSDGRFASNRPVYVGGVACNWLPFGTQVTIEGLGTYTVEDRGAKKYFGSKLDKKKALDIYFDDHAEARRFGVRYKRVMIGA